MRIILHKIKTVATISIMMFVVGLIISGQEVQAATDNLIFDVLPYYSETGDYSGGKVYFRVGSGKWKEVSESSLPDEGGNYRFTVEKGEYVRVKVVPDKEIRHTTADFEVVMEGNETDAGGSYTPVGFDPQKMVKKLLKKSGYKFQVGSECYRITINFIPEEDGSVDGRITLFVDGAVSYKKGAFKIKVHDSDPERFIKLKVSSKADFSVEKPSDTNGGEYVLKIAPEDFKKLRFKVDESFDDEDMQIFLRGSESNTVALKYVGNKLKGIGKFDASQNSFPHFSVELKPQAMPMMYVDFGTYGKMSDDGKSAVYTLDGKKITVTVSKGGGFKDGQVGIPEDLGKVVFKLGGDFNPETMHVLVGERKDVGYDPFLVELYVKKGSYEVSLGKTDIAPNGHFPKTVYFYVVKGKAVMTD